MKKIILTLIVVLASMSLMHAVPALKKPVSVQQPDGTYVTICLHGDEYLHFTTTQDGYSVVKNEQGYYVYADLQQGRLVPTTYVARNAEVRSAADQAYLRGVSKYLKPTMAPAMQREQQAELNRRAKARQQVMRREPLYDYNNFRGLLILVEFNDKKFSRDDFHDLIDDMVNKENYTGYYGTNNRKVTYTGSVRDYFYDNSDGQFSPKFDVFGPYTINYSQYAANGVDNANALVNAAIDAADKDVDFSLYDGNNDQVVDLVYFLFAGYGANFGGNDERLFWPHRSVIYKGNNYVVKDNTYLWDYASSTELYGYHDYPQTVTIDGIGTICHEFGHVLGLPDFYDTDYEENGESVTPNEWSIMSGGSYNNYGRTPVGYSLYERYATGFTTPQVLDSVGDYKLNPLHASNQGYRLNTPVENEYFLLENRQQQGRWDVSLPGHGMLVHRVDSTNAEIWQNNQVNAYPEHNYYELIRANGVQQSATGDPFPGTANVTELNNETSPANLLTWAGKPTTFGLTGIRESGGVISFSLVDVNVLTALSLPAEASVKAGFQLQLQETRTPEGATCSMFWSTSDSAVAVVDNTGLVTGISKGQAIITALAVNSKGDSLKAECTLTVKELAAAANIAAFKALETDEDAVLSLTDAQVLHVYNSDIYLRDSTGAVVLTNTDLKVKAGNRLNGTIYGQYTIADKMPRLKCLSDDYVAANITITQGSTPVPRPVKVEDLTEADYADLLLLESAGLQRLSSVVLPGIYAVSDDIQVRLYNTFGIKLNILVPSELDDRYFDITGILLTRKAKGEVFDELALMAPLKEVETSTAITTVQVGQPSVAVYTTDGRLVARGRSLNELSLPRGIYLVKSGDTVVKCVKP